MATSKVDRLDDDRPPDKRRCSDDDRCNYKYYYGPGKCSILPGILDNAFGRPDANFNSEEPTEESNNGNNIENVDINFNRTEEEQCETSQGRRPTSLPPEVEYRKRSSYHRDVEEALSSLLWQPYEYRSNRSESSDTLSSTLSSCSGDSKPGTLVQSFTDEFLDVTTEQRRRSGNSADPNLSSQMVSNLTAAERSSVGAPAAQSARSVPSRGRDGGSVAASQVDWGRSRECAFVSCSSACRVCNPATTTATQTVNELDVVLTCVRDGSVLSAVDDMRVEIPGPGSQPDAATAKPPDVLPPQGGARVAFVHNASSGTQPRQNQNQNASTVSLVPAAATDHVSRAVFVQTSPRCSVDTAAISSDMIPSNMTSVVSANVVGLPVHSRSSSTLSARADVAHPRSASETAAHVFVQQHLGGHFRSSSNLLQERSGPTPHTRGASEPPCVNVTHVFDTNDRSSLVPGSDLTVIQSNCARTGSETTEGATQTDRVPSFPNVSNVNVNFYRAVPVNVVSSVPTIQCLNSVHDSVGNNVSNVHIVQAMPPSVPSVSVQQVPVQQSSFEVRTRTFTSTEAQTDDTAVGTLVSPTSVTSTREQRRRDRRERRHQRRLNSTNHQHPQPQWPANPNERLPDLLNNHLPPPYTTLPSSVPSPAPVASMVPPSGLMSNPPVPNNLVPFHPGVVPGQVPLVAGQVPLVPGPPPVPSSGFRFPFPSAAGFRRCRSRLGPRYTEEQPKTCCGLLVSRPTSLRWFIALIALVAVCCVLVGTVLGAMRPAGRDHLTVSLLMIGVGIVLVTVSGVAWRLTSHDAPSCRAMLGLESSESADICTRRFVPRLPPSYGRPHHPYAAMIYPEFQYRPPPPSYQASMQEYRLRLLLLDRGTTPQIQNAQHAVSPPPTYRSHSGSLLRAPLSSRRDAAQSEYSCPPSYRSRTSSNRQTGNDTVVHSREQSLTLSESNHDESVVNVVSILTNQQEEITLDNMTLDSLKVAPDTDNLTPLRMLLKSSSGNDLVDTSTKDGNLVTIVQKADQNPVIVTVSGSQMSTTNPEVGSSNHISEMEILAHL